MSFEFVLPLNRDELLRRAGINHYVVDEVFPMRSLPTKLKECQSKFRSEGSLMILTNFDSLFSIIVHFNNIEADIQKEAWNLLLKISSSLSGTLVESLDRDDLSSDERQSRLNALKMTTYLLCQFCDRYESCLSKPVAVATAAAKGRAKKASKASQACELNLDWDEERERAVRTLLQLLQLNVHRLWDPPIAEEEFVSLVTNICYKMLENPDVTKNKSIRDAIFQILGIMVKRFNHTIGCTLKMLQLLQQYEHLAAPFAAAVELFVNTFGVKGIVSEIMREIGRMDPKELSRDSSGTRAYAAFLVELSRCVPAIMLPSISVLLVLLDGESYTMRNSVLGVLGELVLRVLSGGDLDQKHKSTRDQFLDKLEDHVHDVNAFTRSRVLQIWLSIINEKALPLPRQNGLLQLVAGRLMDKSSQVRRNAMQTIIAMLQSNPLAAQLTADELKQNYENELAKLKAMAPEVETASSLQTAVVDTALQAGLEAEWDAMEKDVRKAVKHHLRRKLEAERNEMEESSMDVENIAEDETFDSVRTRLVEMLKNADFDSALLLLDTMKGAWPADQLLVVPDAEEEGSENEETRGDERKAAIGNSVTILKRIFTGETVSKEARPMTTVQDSAIVNAVSKQQVLVQYLKDSVNFVSQIDEAIPIVCQLLGSKMPTDVLEAIGFFVSGFEAGVTGCLVGIRRMLLLVRSKEATVKAAVVDAYKRIYLNTKGVNARAQAVTVANALIALTIGASLGDLTSLNELVQEFVRTKDLNSKVIQALWEKFALKITPTTSQESRGALLLIGMVAGAEIETVRSNVGTLIQEGLGPRAELDFLLARDTCLALAKLASKTKGGEKPFRFPPEHELFGRLTQLLVDGMIQLEKPNWIPMAEQAISLIYRLAEKPDTICADVIKRQAKHILAFKCETAPVDNVFANAGTSGDQPATVDTQPTSTSQPTSASQPTGIELCSSAVLSRFLFVCGHVALQELIHLDVAVFGELKRRRALCENNKQNASVGNSTAARGSKSASRASMTSVSASTARTKASEQTIEEEMGLAGAVAEDAEAECIRRIADTEIVTGSETLLAVLQPLVVAMCTNQVKYNDADLSAAATLALSKFMVVSSEFCEEQLPLLFTIFEKSNHAVVRANAIIAIGDLTFRFPNLIEPWTANIYARLRDDSTPVRKNTLLVLTHLILNDMIKVKGQISELATCVIDDNPQIAGLARVFFSDLAKRGNAIYNILPDVISRLSDPDVGIPEDNFREILRYLMSFIQKDKQCESLVEKLCHRFRATRCERQWRDLSFCLSLLSYNDRSIRKLQENFSCFGDKLSEEFVYGCFTTIIAGARKFSKPEAKVIIDEFEQRVEETYSKGVADDAVAQKAGKASVAARAVRGGKNAKTPGRKTRKPSKAKASSSDDDIEEDDENVDMDEIAAPRPAALRRAATARKKPVLTFSSDEDDDFDMSPKKAGETKTAVNNSGNSDSESDDDVPPGTTVTRKNIRSVNSRAAAPARGKTGSRKK